ncbi:MAG: c-type cytochrome biogenesis protein CcsB [Desulfurivibrionaceae bacterium]|nr:c-type cytochrome biogenesis protein CcsB [Desulfurivibrionaceae bacterium]
MDSSSLLSLSTFGYLAATGAYLAAFLFKSKKAGLAGTTLTALTFLLQTIALGLRWYESYQIGAGHAPLTNMYESLVFFSWAIASFYLILEYKFKNRSLGAFAMPFAFLAMAFASSGWVDQNINPLIPALQSNWLIAHVVTCFIGYAAFAVACGIAVMYLLKEKAPKSTGLLAALPDLKVIDDIIHKCMVYGFLWLSAGIITGAIWANSAWGTYWSWDPKETWSLITWFFYAAILHARFTRGWHGTRIAWLAIGGFLCVVFTYYGVNYLLSGLHSYGGS